MSGNRLTTAGGSFRLEAGGLVDRTREIGFEFDGRRYLGHPGDTLASALLANGVRLVGRSFKYHRPRGIVAAGSEEPCALVELGQGAAREPNTRATTVPLYEGLSASSQNRWPSLRFDLMSVNQVFAPLLAAGFYYKTFMWPPQLWERLYEPLIRRAAGLGRAAGEADPSCYDKVTAHCDVLVVGGGATGLSAALEAARAGARVILADEQGQPGGRAIDDAWPVAGQDAIAWTRAAVAELAAMPDVRLLPRTTVVGVYDGGTYAAVESRSEESASNAGLRAPQRTARQRLWRIVARRAVLATGATERPIVFANNDLPGVMLAGAVRSYINRYAVLPGCRAVVFTNNSDGLRTASTLAAAGATVAAVVDARPDAGEAARTVALKAGADYVAGAVVSRAKGGLALRSVTVREPDGRTREIACDLLAVSGGWNPNLQLATHLGAKPVWDDAIAAFRPDTLPPGMTAAGWAAGSFLLAAETEGARAGARAAEACGFKPGPPPTTQSLVRRGYAITPLWRVANGRGKAFVDLQHDVTEADIELAVREGFSAAEHAKRYTTLGMATDQGRSGGLNGIGILAELTGRSVPGTGITTARPPYAPVAIGVLAGERRGTTFKPQRLPPSHAWAKAHGAVMVEAGLWMRPQYFPRPGERDWLETATREVKAVRLMAGVCDVSTLGKIDVKGRDAARFLDLVYANTMSTLAIGRTRYGIMLREDGIVLDDGTAARLGPEHYVVTTTTANAARVMQHLEHCHQWLWPDLDVRMVPVTDQWAQYAVAGPRARELMRRILDPEHDISNEAFPYMAAGEMTVCGGTRARLFRLSFCGELGYEIAVPARFGHALMQRLMHEGRPLGAVPYGTEALGIMRIEKGHVGGAELNGNTTARDLGLAALMSTKKDYVGRVLAGRPALIAESRPALVGIVPIDRRERLRAGAHFLSRDAAPRAENDEGYVTSAAYSPTRGHWIGLGLLAGGMRRSGEIVKATSPLHREEVLVEVTAPVFHDPKGERLRV